MLPQLPQPPPPPRPDSLLLRARAFALEHQVAAGSYVWFSLEYEGSWTLVATVVEVCEGDLEWWARLFRDEFHAEGLVIDWGERRRVDRGNSVDVSYGPTYFSVRTANWFEVAWWRLGWWLIDCRFRLAGCCCCRG